MAWPLLQRLSLAACFLAGSPPSAASTALVSLEKLGPEAGLLWGGNTAVPWHPRGMTPVGRVGGDLLGWELEQPPAQPWEANDSVGWLTS